MTTIVKHTDGHWKWVDSDYDANNRFCSPELRSGNEIVAYGGQCQWEGLIVINNKADAQLITAAPELLEACKQSINFIEDGYVETMPEVKKVLNFIKQSIAKAEGSANAT